MEPTPFGSAHEEARHWREQATHMQEALREAERGLQEFMESSRELEAELEADVAHGTQRIGELERELESARVQADEWKTRYHKTLTEHTGVLGELHHELAKLRESHEVYKTKLRNMELDNDELENAERMVASSLQDMETQYNRAIERTAHLETELEDKRRLEEEHQRLKDELRELREELAVRGEAPQLAPAPAPASAPLPTAPVDPLDAAPDAELKLSDLVVHRPERGPPSPTPREGLRMSRRTRRNVQKSALEQIRSNMQQLQQRLAAAQIGGDERSAIPRPRSRMSSSIGAASPGVPSTPRPHTPSRRSQSGIPVPSGGLSRSATSLRRPTSRAELPSTPHARPPSAAATASPAPYGFMEHDPATPTTALRRAQLARRRSLGPLPRARAPRPSGIPRPEGERRAPWI